MEPSPPRPVASWRRGLLPLGFAVAIAGGVALAFLLSGVGFGSDEPGDGPITRPSPGAAGTPTPPGGGTVARTIIPSTPAARPPCAAAQVSAALTLEPDGNDVLLRLSLAGNAICTFSGDLTLQTLLPPTDPSPARPPFANMTRDYAVALDFPFSGVIGEWTWSNWCGDPAMPNWVADLGPPAARVHARYIEQDGPFPACIDEGAPTVLRDRVLSDALGGEVVAPTCAAPIAGWLCQYAVFLEQAQADDSLRQIIRTGQQQTYTCSEGGTVVGAEFSALCRDAAAGETRTGYPLTLHGSEGGPVTVAAMISRLDSIIGPPLRSADGVFTEAVSVGFPVQSDGNTRFIVVLATGKQPAIAYLAFVLVPGREPAFIGAGLSGDNALVIARGGVTQSVLGEAEFIALGR